MASQNYGTTFYPRLIPVGADKKFRDIPLETIVNNTSPVEKNSTTQLSRLKETRNLTIYINSKPGQTYSVEREDGGIIFNPSLKDVKTVQFQDGSSIEIKVPLKFMGNIILKRNGEILTKINIRKLDGKEYKSGENPKDLNFAIDCEVKLDNTNKQNTRDSNNLMNYLIQMKSNTVESGLYTINDLIYKVNNHTFKELMAILLTWTNFDHNILPEISGTIDTAVSESQRKKLIERVVYPFFKGVYATIDDAKDIIFSIKGTKGKKILSFLHLVKSQSRMNIHLLQATANVKFLQHTLSAPTSVAGHLKGSVNGSVVGFVVYASAEIVEWWATDNSNIGDLLGALVSTGIKAYIGAFACSVAMGAALAVGLSVVAVVGIGLIAGVLVAMALERLDAHFKLTDKLKTSANIGVAIYTVWSNLLTEAANKVIKFSKLIVGLMFLRNIQLFKVL